MGKTTLLFQLLKRWKGYVHSAFLFQTQCDSRELLRYLMEDLGLDSQDRDIVRMHADLNDFLFRETKAGKRVVLFLDESQNLSDSVLETVRLLSDFEAPDRKLLQIVLAGQPELEQRLARPGLTQLEQRIAVRARLEPLPRTEVIRYMNHRLRVAGYQGAELFTPQAAAAIAERSHGIPRVVNHLCFSALSLGCAMRSRQIGPEIVSEAAGDLSINSRPAKPQATSTRVAIQPMERQAAAAPDPAIPPLSSRMKRPFPQQRVLQTSLLSLLMLGLAIYLGTRAGARTVHKENPNQVSSRYVPAGSKHTSEAPVTTAYDELQSIDSQPSVGRRDSSNVFTYVVQPKDTLGALCLSLVGRYDETVQKEIRDLNPDLKDLTNLQVGQEIRLPLPSSRGHLKTGADKHAAEINSTDPRHP